MCSECFCQSCIKYLKYSMLLRETNATVWGIYCNYLHPIAFCFFITSVLWGSEHYKVQSRCSIYSGRSDTETAVYSALLCKSFGLSLIIKGGGLLVHMSFKNQCWLMHLMCSDKTVVTVFLLLPGAQMDISSLSLHIERAGTYDHMIFMKHCWLILSVDTTLNMF